MERAIRRRVLMSLILVQLGIRGVYGQQGDTSRDTFNYFIEATDSTGTLMVHKTYRASVTALLERVDTLVSVVDSSGEGGFRLSFIGADSLSIGLGSARSVPIWYPFKLQKGVKRKKNAGPSELNPLETGKTTTTEYTKDSVFSCGLKDIPIMILCATEESHLDNHAVARFSNIFYVSRSEPYLIGMCMNCAKSAGLVINVRLTQCE